MHRSSIVRSLFVIALSSVSTACMMGPYHGESQDDHTDPVSFNFYATQAGAEITIDCAPSYDGFGPWQEEVLTFTAGSTPFTHNGETVYSTSGSGVLPEDCWRLVHGRYMTRIRPKQNGYSMRVYNEDGLDCLGTELGSSGPITAGNLCGMKYSNSNSYVPFIYYYADN